MTEEIHLERHAASWLTTEKPQWLAALAHPHSTTRKWRLLGVALCRTCLPFLTLEAENVIEVGEKLADSGLDKSERDAAIEKAFQLGRTPDSLPRAYHFSRVLRQTLTYTHFGWEKRGYAHILQVHRTRSSREVLCNILRDIFGNPFCPVVFDPRWRSESAVALARTAYDTRDFTLLPILADALEEAGCDHPDALTHCREPNGVHVRGCWVVDGVLGKT